MQKITILTNIKNEEACGEDRKLAEMLEKYFSVELKDLFNQDLPNLNFYLIRNVWGRPNGRERMLSLYEQFNKRKIKYSCTFNRKGDQKGKKYLVELFKKGYPVIPTFDDVNDARDFGSTEYLAKPLYGGSSEGILTFSKKNLHNVDTNLYVIQPKLDFHYEVSYFYIDDIFQYSLKTLSSRWDLEQYVPSKQELEIVQKFTDWNPVVGIQRIDFLKMNDESLLLLEIEDWCPYLSLFDVPELDKDSFVRNIAESIKKQSSLNL